MHKGKSILALIPARRGSKGLPGKNIRPLVNKPLIAWTINEAKMSKCIDKIIVSTDSEKIAEISRKYGAEVPFIRPKSLATDAAKGIGVVLHSINWMERNDKSYSLLILLQPTSPLRTHRDIDNSIEMLFNKNAKSIVSVCETEHHPYWANILPQDGCMKDFIKPEIVNKNRQELPKFYRLNGAIYLAYWDYIKNKKTFFGTETFAYIIPQKRSIDIDTELDFKLCDIILKEKIIKD